jgi:DNA polymerase-3 subunit delta
MPSATLAAVRKQIAAGRPDPVYLLHGEDETEKSALTAAFVNLVDEEVRAFNVDKFHGGDMTTTDKLVEGIGSIVAAARTVPMVSPRRIVLVRQADGLIAPRRDSEIVTAAYEQFEELLSRPAPQSTLVLVADNVDRRSRLYKLLVKHATLVACGTIERPGAEAWVSSRVAAAGQVIDPGAANLLAVRAGTDMKRLRSDVERLLLYALGQKRIGVDAVLAVTGPETLQDQWDMANAIERGEDAKALRQLALMFEAGGIPEMILGQLGWLVRTNFTTLPPAALRRAVDALFRTDLDLKRSAGDARVLLERLVIELCAVKRTRPGRRR